MVGKLAVQNGQLEVEVVKGQYEMLHQGLVTAINVANDISNSPTFVWFRDLYSSKSGKIAIKAFGTIKDLSQGMVWSIKTLALLAAPEPFVTKGLAELTALKANYHLASYLKNFNELIILLFKGD